MSTLGVPQEKRRTRSQGSPSQLLMEQNTNFESLSRMCQSSKRLVAGNVTMHLLQKRQSLASQLWNDIRDVHLDIGIAFTAEEKAEEAYFTQDLFGTYEEIYLETIDQLSILMDKLPPPAAYASAGPDTPPPETTPAPPATGASHSIPRLTIPTFNGDINSWDCFHDLFKSIIVEDPHLRNVEKFFHLKTRLVGEALTAIQNIPVTDANFQDAWDLLTSRFSNKHLAIFSQVSQLLNLQQVPAAKPQLLRALIDQTRSILDSLKRLGEPTTQWSTLIVVLTVLRLDRQTRQEWDRQPVVEDEFPTFDDLESFIVQRINSLTIAEFKPPSFEHKNKVNQNVTSSNSRFTAHASHAHTNRCAACTSSHALAACFAFKKLAPQDRLQIVQKNRFCYNCLKAGHFPDKCLAKNNCTSCKRRHHALLHDGLATKVCETSVVFPETSDYRAPAGPTEVSMHFARRDNDSISDQVLLATALVRVSTPQGRSLLLRALIDQGSERTLISEAAAQALHVDRQPFSAIITGIGDQPAGHIRHRSRVKISSQYSENDHVYADALIMQKLTSYVPRQTVNLQPFPQLRELQLADRLRNNTAPIMLVIGADVYGNILRQGLVQVPGAPTAQQTLFGWILSGGIPSVNRAANSIQNVTAMHVVTNSELHASIENFWSIEDVPKVVHSSPDDAACEKLFTETTSRDSSGRYCVSLPFKQSPPINIGYSYEIALRAFNRMEKRLDRDPDLADQYNEFLLNYLSLGHMVPFNPANNEQCCYIPHHPVFKEGSTSTKLRVVFNASCPTSNGCSLNDNLMVGPKLHQELPAILIRWRKHRYVCTADVTKMFRQILVADNDTRYQIILWRPKINEDIKAFRLLTVTYGTAPAPYLSLRVLQQLASDECHRFPLASAEIPRSIYVDDALIGASSIEECLLLRDDLINLMASGCLPLRKWSANHPALLKDLPPTDCELSVSKSFQEDTKLKILGTSWNPSYDQLYFSVNLEPLSVLTKRTVLSQISKLFDPLGLVAPVVVVGKILMQKLWRLGLEWDQSLPPNLIVVWQTFCKDLGKLSGLKIPRWVGTVNTTSVQLHGFCDASQEAYAAVVYLRAQNGASVSIHLLSAKTRVAPIKTYVSIPRMELCGAELLSRLLQWCYHSLDLPNIPVYAWSDSSVTLQWISEYPARWKTFVANRVSAIQSRALPTSWRYVPTNENPADVGSRGMSAFELIDFGLWWHGPKWLRQDKASWPNLAFSVTPDIDTEDRVISTHLVVLEEWDFASRYSDWGKLLRVTSLIFKFVHAAGSREKRTENMFDAAIISVARDYWCRYVQARNFQKELTLLSSGQKLPRGSRIAALDPFLDEHGLIRAGGRLQNASLAEPRIHPIILVDHDITRLMIKHAHLRTLHGGAQLTMRLLREQFWILRVRPVVRGIIAKCVTCVRHRAQLCSQKMAPLPAIRVTPAPPFASVGIDYAGPFLVRSFAGRGHQARKAWVALFICLRVKAVHLELVMDCSTPSFLAAFRRFCSRRGVPSIVLSDNGTNFQGADKAIQKAFQQVMKNPVIESTFASEGITWRFIPPASPHFGGIWESGVKSMKHHLRRVISSHTLTVEEFTTLTCQIEACLNSRPLTPLLNDPDDLSVLTPGHFLTGRPLCAYPEPMLLDVKESHLTRWQLVQQMRDHFWKAWRLDYLAVLQKRTKWLNPHSDVRENSIVLLHQDNVPPAKWPLGRVLECLKGPDGLIRVCRVKTADTILLRPVHKMCVLPIDANIAL